MAENTKNLANLIWSVADKLRGNYKRSEYGKVILPFTVLRRLECTLEDTKQKVLAAQLPEGESLCDLTLRRLTDLKFYNTSPYDFRELIKDVNNIQENMNSYVAGFSANVRDLLDHFKFAEVIQGLEGYDLLLLVTKEFANFNLDPRIISNHDMGAVYEELIRKFAEESNETAGEHFTPREVIRLMVALLFNADDDALTKKGVIRTIYDPACGTGGMLTAAEEYLKEMNPDATIKPYGQEWNEESYAICMADLLIKGHEIQNIYYRTKGTIADDGTPHGMKFNYMLCNPPFGVEWKKYEKEVKDEYEKLGQKGRFGAGLPPINDGALLFLQHMLSKMNPDDEGTRIAIVFSGSPMFSGAAGSGPSNIRRWIIENDWLEAIVALPDQLFYNTGIFSYVWILGNKKIANRRGKIQLINATQLYQKMSRSVGNKRHVMTDDHIGTISALFGKMEEGPLVKIFPNAYFGYTRITVDRPLRLSFDLSEEKLAEFELSNSDLNMLGSVMQLKGQVIRSADEFRTKLLAEAKHWKLKLKATDIKRLMDFFGERDPEAEPVIDKDGYLVADPDLRDTENVPLTEDIQAYFEREVLPHAPDAWWYEGDEKMNKVGYEIPLTREFYTYSPPPALGDLEAELAALTSVLENQLLAIKQN